MQVGQAHTDAHRIKPWKWAHSPWTATWTTGAIRTRLHFPTRESKVTKPTFRILSCSSYNHPISHGAPGGGVTLSVLFPRTARVPADRVALQGLRSLAFAAESRIFTGVSGGCVIQAHLRLVSVSAGAVR